MLRMSSPYVLEDHVSDQDPQVQDQEPETHASPDDEAGPAVAPAEPTEGSQGDFPAPAAATGFSPDAPVATSAPDPSTQPGVPPLPENEGVEAQEEYRGPVDVEGSNEQGSVHSEANESDLDDDAEQ